MGIDVTGDAKTRGEVKDLVVGVSTVGDGEK
jgi:hypothetical protein